MSLFPSGPGARPKSSCLPSRESDGRDSPAAVFTTAAMLTGADQGSAIRARVEAQMSWPPCPPARLDESTTSSPSARTFGWMSLPVASLSAATGVAGPKRAPFWRVLMKISPATAGVTELREK
jgi:hypothetical protein